MPRPDLIVPLVSFAVLMLLVSLLALSAGGHFPRRRDANGGPGTLALWVSMAAGAASLVVAVAAAWRLLPWPPAIIAAGLAILAAPLVLQQFSDRFVDGRGALVTFAMGAAAFALLLVFLSGQPA